MFYCLLKLFYYAALFLLLWITLKHILSRTHSHQVNLHSSFPSTISSRLGPQSEFRGIWLQIVNHYVLSQSTRPTIQLTSSTHTYETCCLKIFNRYSQIPFKITIFCAVDLWNLNVYGKIPKYSYKFCIRKKYIRLLVSLLLGDFLWWWQISKPVKFKSYIYIDDCMWTAKTELMYN